MIYAWKFKKSFPDAISLKVNMDPFLLAAFPIIVNK